MARKAIAQGLAVEVISCRNCQAEARYLLGDAVNPIHYCDKCLPEHFRLAAAAGDYALA